MFVISTLKNLTALSITLLSLSLITGCDLTDETANNSTTVVDGTVVDTVALVNLGEKLYNDTNLSVPAEQCRLEDQ